MAITAKERGMAIGAALVILIATVLVSRTCSSDGTRRTTKLVRSMGTLVGEEVAPILGTGTRVVVLSYADDSMDEDIKEQKVQFQKALKDGGVEILDVRILERTNADSPEEQGFSVAEYLQVAHEFPEVDSIVSLTGHLRVNQKSLATIPDSAPPLALLYVSGGQPGLDTLVQRGIVKLAVVPKAAHLLADKSGPPASTEAWLAEYFDVVTATSPPSR